MNDTSIAGIIAMLVGFVLMFFVGVFAAIEETPKMLTNDCMMYNEVYYCPTDMPEGLVMPVE